MVMPCDLDSEVCRVMQVSSFLMSVSERMCSTIYRGVVTGGFYLHCAVSKVWLVVLLFRDFP